MTEEAYKRALNIDREKYNIEQMRTQLKQIEKENKGVGIVGRNHEEPVFAIRGFRDYLLQAIKQALGEYEAQLTKEFEEL